MAQAAIAAPDFWVRLATGLYYAAQHDEVHLDEFSCAVELHYAHAVDRHRGRKEPWYLRS